MSYQKRYADYKRLLAEHGVPLRMPWSVHYSELLALKPRGDMPYWKGLDDGAPPPPKLPPKWILSGQF